MPRQQPTKTEPFAGLCLLVFFILMLVAMIDPLKTAIWASNTFDNGAQIEFDVWKERTERHERRTASYIKYVTYGVKDVDYEGLPD